MQEWQKGATPQPRSGAAAERSYPTAKVRGGGREELPHSQGQGRRPRGATPRPRSGVAAERSYPTAKVRGGGREELPHVQGKEQRLCFAGAAVKRYPTSKVRNPSKMVGTERRHQRADRLKPQSQTTSQSDHMDHSLV